MSYPMCKCGHPQERSEEYDAYFCRKCDEWREDKCSDLRGCPYCPNRPDKPSEVKQE